MCVVLVLLVRDSSVCVRARVRVYIRGGKNDFPRQRWGSQLDLGCRSSQVSKFMTI